MTVSQPIRRELQELKTTRTVTTEATTSDDATTEVVHVPADARRMWVHLITKFGKKAGLTPLLDYKALVRFDFIDDGTLEAQFNKLLDTRSICSLNDFIMEDWQFASLTLLTLPNSVVLIRIIIHL